MEKKSERSVSGVATFFLVLLVLSAYFSHLRILSYDFDKNRSLKVQRQKSLTESSGAKLSTSFAPLVKKQKKIIIPAEDELQLIDINTAGAKDLETLPGVGPAIAREIISFRQKGGEIKEAKDLLAVKGIGEKKLNKILPYIKLEKSNEVSALKCPYCGELNIPVYGRRLKYKPYCKACLKYLVRDS